VTYVGLTLDRAVLSERLKRRAAAFVAAGLRQEVRGLLAQGYSPALPALQSIGYREFVEVEQGRITEDEALRRMQRDTVRYAKRQWTWFAREPSIEWIGVEAAGGPAAVAETIARRLFPSRTEGVSA
jgi:tRNA dimethylallyltransferase